MFKEVILKIDDYGEGPIEADMVERKVGDFNYHYTIFAHEAGLYSVERRKILEFELHLEKFLKELAGDWNQDREVGAKKHDIKIDASRSGKEADPSMDDFSTPKKVCKIRYLKATPKEEKTKIDCHLCECAYATVRALKKHIKQKHPDGQIDATLKDKDDKITCRMCPPDKIKYSRDQIGRHLALVHGVKKLNSKASIRGWITGNDVDWKPLFLCPHEKDPPPTTMLSVNKDSKVSVYGITFEPTEYICVISEDGEIPREEMISEGASQGSDPGTIKKLSPVYLDFKDDKQMSEDQSAVIVVNKDNGSPEDNLLESPFMASPSFGSCLLEESPEEDRVKRRLFDDLAEDDHSFDLPQNFSGEGSSQHERKRPRMTVTNVVAQDVIMDVDTLGDEPENDSDYEEGDTKTFTIKRMARKASRQDMRNKTEEGGQVFELEKKSEIISRFEDYMNNKKLATSKDPSKISTLKKHKGHLFTYNDSLLNFEIKRDPSFNLERLISPLAEDFLELKDPTEVRGWMSSMGGASGKEFPSRRKESLKAHARFREFLLEELNHTDFGDTTKDYLRKGEVLRHLEQIGVKISKSKIFSNLKDLDDAEQNEKNRAKNIVYPSNDYNEARSIVKWFQSEEAKVEEAIALDTYRKAMKGEEVATKEFNQFACWARFTVCLEDRNRRGAYSFKNLDYMQRVPKWLPPKKKNDTRAEIDRFDELPAEWDPDQPPSRDAPPSVWCIPVSGKELGLKGNENTEIVLTRRGEELCAKYREMKFACLLEDEDNEDPFFVNKKGKSLGPIQRTKGSLLEKLGKVCGVENPTVNSFRRATEVHVQASPLMKQASKKIQLHSAEVGQRIYDKSGSSTRASFINQLAEIESPQKGMEKVSAEAQKKRALREREDKEAVIKHAKSVLEKDKAKKQVPRRKKNRIVHDARDFLGRILSDSLANQKGIVMQPKTITF